MPVSGASFICARRRAPENMAHKDMLVLDAFSDVGQFVEYDPAVWHPYCLWAFANTQQPGPGLCCYGVKTGTKSFVFIGDYSQHSDQVRSSNSNGVRDLIVKPLTLYRHNCRQLGVPEMPTPTVISRSWQANIAVYLPLAYVHLLVQPTTSHYADVAYDGLLQDILKYAVGRTQAYIVGSLIFSNETTLIRHPDPVDMTGIRSLCDTHYNLMVDHKFVFPANATQQQILFDAIEDGEHSQHLDYIAALCDVRYNWVFTREHQAAWHLLPLKPDAPFHQIDVHRHITHLQAAHDTKSDLLKPLSIGFHVTDSADPKRKGVIIFDVQSYGRLHEYFTGDTAARPWSVMFTIFLGALTPDLTPTVKEHTKTLFKAMKEYFNVSTSPAKKDLPNRCTLSDMTYKYAVLQDDGKIFIQDSHALTVDNTPPSCDRCLFCPACLMEPSIFDMHDHIKTDHSNYYLADSPESNAGSSSIDPSANGSSGSNSSVSIDSSSDKSLELREDAEHERTGLQLLELKNRTEHTDNADETQAHVSQSNYAVLEKQYNDLAYTGLHRGLEHLKIEMS